MQIISAMLIAITFTLALEKARAQHKKQAPQPAAATPPRRQQPPTLPMAPGS